MIYFILNLFKKAINFCNFVKNYANSKFYDIIKAKEAIMDKGIKFTKDFYENDANTNRYSSAVDKVGLWNSEKVIFQKYINKCDKILDVGCGAGRTTINLYKMGYTNITGLDLSSTLIDYAQNYAKTNNLNIEFINADATKLPFSDNLFDVVIFSYNGMQCIPGKKNRDNVLKEVYRVLKPNGLYIFTAHNRDDSGKYQKGWDDEKIKWENGTQDKSLEMFGDRYTPDREGSICFVHFSNIEEMIDFVQQENFKVVEYAKNTDLAEESEQTKEFAGNTVFWVVKKL